MHEDTKAKVIGAGVPLAIIGVVLAGGPAHHKQAAADPRNEKLINWKIECKIAYGGEVSYDGKDWVCQRADRKDIFRK